MKTTKKYLAFDLGASGGRAVAGTFRDGILALEEIHRFPNDPLEVNGSVRWDVTRLFSEIKKGLAVFSKKYGRSLDGIGLDTWGVDFGLFDKGGNLLENPHHYRDKRTEGMVDDIAGKIDPYRFYETTGMLLSPILTLCQLYSMVKSRSPLLEKAESLLMMPGIFNYFLTGEKAEEYTIFSASGLYDARKNARADEFLKRLSIPGKIMPRLVKPGTIVGKLSPEISEEAGLGDVPVVAPACHDTASAAAAVPASNKNNWAFISSGTWSVVGIETGEPIINKKSFQHNICNEGAVAGKMIAVANITGLWIVQQCKKAWNNAGQKWDWPGMIKKAQSAQPFTAFIDPDHKAFGNPPDMPGAIREYCKNTGQKVPEDEGTVIRIALESLALKYKKALEQIESLQGKAIDVLNIVGGGTRNKLLNQLTADATGKTVLAGPVEATAIGNIMMQAIGTGYIKSIDEARGIIRSSFEIETYSPENRHDWNKGGTK